MKTEISTYEKQALDFAKKHGVKMIVKHKKFGSHFAGEKDKRHIFRITLKRNGKQFSFDFGQSIAAGNKEPNLYDILACLTKYDVGSFEDFCGDFGYEFYTKGEENKIKKIYNAVCKEFENVDKLFNDCIEELQEIS